MITELGDWLENTLDKKSGVAITPLLSSQCAFSSLCEVFSYPFSFAHCVTTKTWLTDEF